MATGRWFVCAAVPLLSVVAISFSASAEGLTVHPVDGRSLSINPNDIRQTDTGEAAQAPGNEASKVTDLETTRAALDRRAGPALSLSVSGWVAEQVIRAH